jgi:hypothetical protein
MLEEKDIERLIQVLATKAEFNEVIEGLARKAGIDRLLNSIDAYAHKADTYFQEMVMLSHKMNA